MLWLASLVASCGGSTAARCADGTFLSRNGVCVTSADAGLMVTCGAGTVEDAGRCVLVRRVSDAGSAGDRSSDVPAPDHTPPVFGGPVAAETAGDSEVLVSWKPAVDDVTPSARIVYDVAWGDHSGFSPDWTTAIRTGHGAMDALVTGLLPPKAPFYFRARAVDEAGNADDNQHEVTADTGPDTTPPKFTGCGSVHDISYESFIVDWGAATDNGTPASSIVYEVWVRAAGATGDPRSAFTTTTVTGALHTTISGLRPGKDYEVLCGAKDAAGNQDDNQHFLEVTTTADTHAPTFGGVVSAAVGDAANSVVLTWNAATDDVIATSQVVYLVFVSTKPGGEDFRAQPPS